MTTSFGMQSSSSPAPSILKRPKLLIKPSSTTAGKKRKAMEMDGLPSPSSSLVSSPGSSGGSPPKKRPHVQFSQTVETRYLSTAEGRSGNDAEVEKSAAVVREEIRRAVQRHLYSGDSEAYDKVKEIFSTDPRKSDESGSLPPSMPTHTTLKNHLMGLLSNVASLDRNCSGLVQSVLRSEWLGRDESYVKLFIRFLGNLSAAHGSYLRSVLNMLVSYLSEGK